MSCFRTGLGRDGRVAESCGEFGRNATAAKGPGYEPGMELLGKYVFLSEACAGSLSKHGWWVIAIEPLRGYPSRRNTAWQKLIWEIDPAKHKPAPSPTRWAGHWAMNCWPAASFNLSRLKQSGLCRFLSRPPELQKPYLFPTWNPALQLSTQLIAELLDRSGNASPTAARAISEAGFPVDPQPCIPRGGALLVLLLAGLVKRAPALSGNHKRHACPAFSRAEGRPGQRSRAGGPATR